MKIHRFYMANLQVAGNNIVIIDEEKVHQMKNVFRYVSGDQISIFDNLENEYICEFTLLSKKEVSLNIIKVLNDSEKIQNHRKITLAFALLKGEHTEMILEKCTELGVSQFQPLITDRTVKSGFRRDRLEKIITEATEQSGWSKAPKLAEPQRLSSFLGNVNLENLLVLDMYGEKIKTSYNSENTILLIGPEGGWSDAERDTFKKLGLQIYSLGPQTLRAETACIASVSALN